jgi:hypothetical protein
MTAAEAAAQGYRQLTSPYHHKREAALLDAVKRDLERGRIAYQVVEETPGHFAVWRKGWVELPSPAMSVVRGIRGARE